MNKIYLMKDYCQEKSLHVAQAPYSVHFFILQSVYYSTVLVIIALIDFCFLV